ncbi:MAG: phosphatase PAP2 family protein [Aquaticitalea sp.]
MEDNLELDSRVVNNFRNVKLWWLIPPFLLLILFFLYFSFSEGTNFVDDYAGSQKNLFFFLNGKLSEYPNFQINVTQLGDALIFFPLLIIFLYYAPKLWQALLTSSIISLLVSAACKRIFDVPRPADMFDNDSFVIIGKRLAGATSLPSGHSITAIMIITILLYAFMPKKSFYKILWFFLMFTIGLIIVFSRVGIGAHYPFDVIIGSAIGYIAAIIGIKVNNNVRWLDWIEDKRFYPIFILLLLIWTFLIVRKIVALNLLIFYLPLVPLVVTLFIITNVYVKKN